MLDLALLGEHDQGIAAAIAALAEPLVLHGVRPEAVVRGGSLTRAGSAMPSTPSWPFGTSVTLLPSDRPAPRRRQTLARDHAADDARRRDRRQRDRAMVHLQDRAVHVMAVLLHAAADLAHVVVGRPTVCCQKASCASRWLENRPTSRCCLARCMGSILR
jgi:hypothetical protein